MKKRQTISEHTILYQIDKKGNFSVEFLLLISAERWTWPLAKEAIICPKKWVLMSKTKSFNHAKHLVYAKAFQTTLQD